MFFRRAEAERIPVSRLLEGQPYDLAHLQNKHERTEWGATYDIVYPKGGAALAWVVRVFTYPFTIRSAGRELKEANEALMARYAELEDARAVLALQATQLSVAHTISGLIHGDLDLD